MNDGFIGLMGIWTMLVLLWSGWFDSFFQENRLSKRLVIGVLFLLLIGGSWTYSIMANGEIAVIPYSLPLLCGFILWIRQAENYRVHILTASLLVGASVFLLQLLFRLDPILMLMDERYLIALFVTVLVMVSAKPLVHQFVLLCFGLSLSDLCFQIYALEKAGFFYAGSPFYLDIYWASLFSLLGTRYLLRWMKWPSLFKRKRPETS